MIYKYFQNGGYLDTIKVAENIAHVVYYCIGIFVYIFMYYKRSQLIILFHQWRQLALSIPSELQNKQLFRDLNIIAGFLLSVSILQNGLTHWNIFVSPKLLQQKSILEVYYNTYFPKYPNVIDYNPFLALALFLCDKWTIYAWTFGDALISVIGYTIYKKFKIYNEHNSKQLFHMKSKEHWLEILRDHQKVVDFVENCNKYLGPLILACILSNIYFIAITLNRFLAASSPYSIELQNVEELSSYQIGRKIISIGSLVQLLTKTYVSVMCCAKVNEHGHKILAILDKCPVSLRTKEVLISVFYL